MSIAISPNQYSVHIRDYFQGISQTLFLKNAYFGALLILISIAFNFHIFACAFVASLIGYGYSTLYRTPKILRQNGLMTINGFFFGVAFASLFQESPPFYFCFLIGAFSIPLLTKALFEILQHWKLSPLIGPYILAIWILWLCSGVIALPQASRLGILDQSFIWSQFTEIPLWAKLLKSMFLSMGQIFFFRNSDYGLFLLVLISIFSPRRGFYFLIGTALATLSFYGISGGESVWQLGFFSYSAGLVGIGLAAQPEKFNWRTILLFCVLSLFLSLALERLLSGGGVGLPILSLPYVMTFWFAMLSRAPRVNVGWAPSEVI
ncbi:MAG: hypothetical protein A2622_13425 [Bdellovibrionales bacterium RIFCSPHIGHO2_01_FULL_40_29]|nr:MAG: hypothetical protein A2622_13425 [Bdellovibrionales bacterium RIFCSPHIGHO2_01_FULL_40_29]OFZ34303.1 MAG: hypothetical protein A3D17_04525 [Bdellovibrionales bacterium RIFCSPHIGHO2_02_FULL_40_15]